MALNKFMHPKNIYKKKQPCFKDLAITYEEFRKHTTQDEAGKVHLDFKDVHALRALSWVLLKDDFGLDVDLPLDRLIPTIPLRVNYILWIKDIVGNSKNVRGIDIGCGASCVYPLLAVKMNKWRFLATEVDDSNFEYAKSNVEKNGLDNRIKLVKVDRDSDIISNLEDDVTYDFTMCNPPFFGSNLEAYGLTGSRNSERSEPKSVSTASESEAITPGGEVEFVCKMIEESLSLKDRIRVFTTMLGKKSSVGPLKEILRKKEIRNIGTFEFCQGRTMRWGLGWSFDPKIEFPKSPFQASKTPEKAPLCIIVPREVSVAQYEIQSLGRWLVQILEELRLKFLVIMDCEGMWSASVTAHENTWSHQRRKRRAEKRAHGVLKKMSISNQCVTDVNRNQTSVLIEADSSVETRCLSDSGRSIQPENHTNETMPETTKPVSESLDKTELDSKIMPQLNEGPVPSDRQNLDFNTDETANCEPSSISDEQKTNNELPVLFNAWFTFKFDDDDAIFLEFKWLKGTQKESLHQVMQLIKNRMRASPSNS